MGSFWHRATLYGVHFRRVVTHIMFPLVFAAAGAWGTYLMLNQWLRGLLAPGMIGSDVPYAIAAAFGLVSTVALACFLPVVRRWRPSTKIAAIGASIIGASGLIASVGVAVAGAATVCPDLCSPVRTWGMLPSVIVSALLAGLGPMFYAVARTPRDLGGFPDTRGQVYWALAALFGVIGFGFAMVWWVEYWLYPGS